MIYVIDGDNIDVGVGIDVIYSIGVDIDVGVFTLIVMLVCW